MLTNSLLVLTFLIFQSSTCYSDFYFNEYQKQPSTDTLSDKNLSNNQDILQANEPNKYVISWYPNNNQNDYRKSDSETTIPMQLPYSKIAPFIIPPTLRSQKIPYEHPQVFYDSFSKNPLAPQQFSIFNSPRPLNVPTSPVYPFYPRDMISAYPLQQIPLVYALYPQNLPVILPIQYPTMSPMTLPLSPLDLTSNNLLTMATNQNFRMNSVYPQLLANYAAKANPEMSYFKQPTPNKLFNEYSPVDSQHISPLKSFTEHYLQDQPLENSTNSVFPEKENTSMDPNQYMTFGEEKKSEINKDYLINNIQKENALKIPEPANIDHDIKLNEDKKKEESLEIPSDINIDAALEPLEEPNNLKLNENIKNDIPEILNDEKEVLNTTQKANDINPSDFVEDRDEDVKEEIEPSNTSNINDSTENVQDDTHEIIEEDISEEDSDENEYDNDYLLKKQLQKLYSNYGKP